MLACLLPYLSETAPRGDLGSFCQPETWDCIFQNKHRRYRLPFVPPRFRLGSLSAVIWVRSANLKFTVVPLVQYALMALREEGEVFLPNQFRLQPLHQLPIYELANGAILPCPRPVFVTVKPEKIHGGFFQGFPFVAFADFFVDLIERCVGLILRIRSLFFVPVGEET